MLQSLELDFNTTKLGSSVDFAKADRADGVLSPVFHNIVWANSLRIGLAQPFANSRVPLSEAFFTGGGNTLRGFPLDGAGPQRQVQVCSSGIFDDCSYIQVPSGGNEQLILNSEARIPLSDQAGFGIGCLLRRRQRVSHGRLSRFHVALHQQRGPRSALRDTSRARYASIWDITSTPFRE